MSEDPIRILIVDDDPDDIALLTGDLADCGYEVWTASTGEDALAQAQVHPVDMALVDVRLPGPTGIELIPRLQALLPEVTIILLTNYGTIPQAVEAMREGAFDFLEKPVALKQLQAVVERAGRTKQTQAKTLSSLTEREREVMQLLVDGKTDAEIAEALRLGASTVNTHVHHILARLNVKNRTQAVTLWLRHTGK
jgi:FixJ family two-component response regulator